MKARLVIFCISFGFSACFGQDYLIAWNNDTIQCVLPDPAKEGIKPAYRYRNGYTGVTALLGNDSIRIIQPGEIKGYYRQSHGKNLLCDGYFESVKVPEGDISLTNADGRKDFTWRFMALVQSGKHASLYKLLQWGSRLYTYHYVVKHGGRNEPAGYLMGTKKYIEKALADEGIEEEMTAFIKKNKKYKAMVKEYNRLKEMSVSGKQALQKP